MQLEHNLLEQQSVNMAANSNSRSVDLDKVSKAKMKLVIDNNLLLMFLIITDMDDFKGRHFADLQT